MFLPDLRQMLFHLETKAESILWPLDHFSVILSFAPLASFASFALKHKRAFLQQSLKMMLGFSEFVEWLNEKWEN